MEDYSRLLDRAEDRLRVESWRIRARYNHLNKECVEARERWGKFSDILTRVLPDTFSVQQGALIPETNFRMAVIKAPNQQSMGKTTQGLRVAKAFTLFERGYAENAKYKKEVDPAFKKVAMECVALNLRVSELARVRSEIGVKQREQLLEGQVVEQDGLNSKEPDSDGPDDLADSAGRYISHEISRPEVLTPLVAMQVVSEREHCNTGVQVEIGDSMISHHPTLGVAQGYSKTCRLKVTTRDLTVDAECAEGDIDLRLAATKNAHSIITSGRRGIIRSLLELGAESVTIQTWRRRE